MTITINRGDTSGLPFSITDPTNSLLGKRVTWAVGSRFDTSSVLKKAGGMPGSTTDVTVTTQSAGQINGKINLAQADYDKLPEGEYRCSLWIDDGTAQLCVTPGGVERLIINPAISRT